MKPEDFYDLDDETYVPTKERIRRREGDFEDTRSHQSKHDEHKRAKRYKERTREGGE